MRLRAITISLKTLANSHIKTARGRLKLVRLQEDFCSVPKGQWQPTSALVKKLESQGWKIRNMKVDSGML